jgi:hypothetical protein
MKFKSEHHMSLHFHQFILSNIIEDNMEIFEQFDGLFGIPDYLLIEKDLDTITTIITFELKLNNWQRALKQAFKYKSFSNACFVVLDEAYLNRAIENINKFIHFNIGLASFNTNEELKIYFDPAHSEPFSQYFLNRIHKLLDTEIDTTSESHNPKLRNKLASFITLEEASNKKCT